MSYKRYVAGLENRRTLLRAELEKANHLRLEAQLPTRDIDRFLDDQMPIMPKAEHATHSKQQRGFARFRRQQLGKASLPAPAPPTDWQQQRARVLRQAFIQHQVQVARENSRLSNQSLTQADQT